MLTKQQRYRQTEKGKAVLDKYTKSEAFKQTQRKARIKRLYSITVEQYDMLIEHQQGRCAICGKLPTDRLHIDHDHNTGRVRGLLCGECNKALGLFGDDISSLQAAINYLKK